METNPLHVLALNPFHGGSHRQFLDSLTRYSCHRWTKVVGKPVHWKWRMRSAPLELAQATASVLQANGPPDVIFCTDMLDLPQWRGLLRDPRVLTTPTVIYFHENQLTYPVAPQARTDAHFGYTNLLSAITADACWFNSEFHREDFLAACGEFIRRMPDAREIHDLESLRQRTKVIPAGFDPPCPAGVRSVGDKPLTIGWVSRWEHDKRPDQFLEVLKQIESQGIAFDLVLLGPRPAKPDPALSQIRQHFADRILHDEFAETREEYWRWLQKMDVVVSTADHEFFGIAICEAIWAGAVPVLPNRLSYPELTLSNCRYDTLQHAVDLLVQFVDPQLRGSLIEPSQRKIASLRMEQIAGRVDEELRGWAAK